MAVIHTDLSITTAQFPGTASSAIGAGATGAASAAQGAAAEPVAGVAGAMVVGRLAAIRVRLVELFGPPTIMAALGEGSLGWVIDTPGGVAAVRAVRHHSARHPDLRHDPYAVISWQVVAHDTRPLMWLCKTITGSTSTVGTAAATTARHPQLGPMPTVVELVAAYADYLALRCNAVTTQLSRARRLSGSRRALRHLQDQLSRQHTLLVEVLRQRATTQHADWQLAETDNRQVPAIHLPRRTGTAPDARPDAVDQPELIALLERLAGMPATRSTAGGRGWRAAHTAREFRATLTGIAALP